jgi:hypothetical protein
LCQRAIEMAERQVDQEARAEATITIALCNPDFDKAISLMLEAAAISEANKLWNTASRAHINLGVVLNQNFQNLESVYQQHLQAIDILIRIGNSEGVLFELDNLAENLAELGHLKFIEAKLIEILRDSTAPQDRIDKYLDNIHSELPDWTGEWTLALEYNRHRRGKARETSQYQTIANRNLRIVNICLELNRFRGMADLSEAEAALRENIEIGWLTPESRILMTVIFSRMGRFADAHEYLDEVIRKLDQPIPKPIQMYLFRAEAELARAEGRWDEAAANCQALIDVYQAGVYRWKHARQLINLGDALISRGLPGDREQAQQVYRQALEMFTEMGSPGYIQVLEERLRSI